MQDPPAPELSQPFMLQRRYMLALTATVKAVKSAPSCMAEKGGPRFEEVLRMSSSQSGVRWTA